MWFVNIFSQYESVSAFSLAVSFTEQKFFHFDELHLHSSFMNQNIMPKNSFPSFRSRSVSPMFSSISFRESIKVNFWIRCFSFYCIWMLNASSTICWKNSIFYLIAYVPCQKSMAIFMWFSFGTLYSVHWSKLYPEHIIIYYLL